ncbi:MAG: hypothetical protein ACKV2V_04510 [Blastocatellia bacterium]
MGRIHLKTAINATSLAARLARALPVRGQVEVAPTVDGQPANVLRVSFK